MSIKIQTTQNVTLNLRAAGLGLRILARILDSVFIFIWIFLVFLVFISFSLDFRDDAIIVMFLILMIPCVFYDLLFEYFANGQSLGKKIVKIRVVNIDGTTPSAGSYLIRWLFRLVDFTLTSSILAVIMVATTKKSQRLGDLLAGTTVINLRAESGSEDVSLFDLDFHENYTVVYPDVLDKLNDRDINTIRSIVNDHRYNGDEHTVRYLTDKVKETTGYTYSGSDRAFLRKIIDDYNYLSIQ